MAGKGTMQFGVSSLIHTAALARWTSASFSFRNRFNGFRRDLEGHQPGKPLKRLGGCESGPL
jgi:hypothetical protein